MKIDKITPQIAALYLGQKWEVSKQPIYWNGDELSGLPEIVTGATLSYLRLYSAFEIILHLRRLESITEEEAREICEISYGPKLNENTGWSDRVFLFKTVAGISGTVLSGLLGCPSAWLYLLSKGVDLFGLIDAGLAKEIENGSK